MWLCGVVNPVTQLSRGAGAKETQLKAVPWQACPPHHLSQRIPSWPYSLASIPGSSTHLQGPVQAPLSAGSPHSLSPPKFLCMCTAQTSLGRLGQQAFIGRSWQNVWG